jgi:type IV pilus assembly protein PilM
MVTATPAGNGQSQASAPATHQGETATAPRLRRAWRPGFWLRQQALLGLDVGSATVKAVVLQRSDGRIKVRRLGLAAVPASAVTNGTLTDGISTAELLRTLCADYHIRTTRVAAAVGGEKVLCHTEVLADLPVTRSKVEVAAAGVLPYPLDRAALDYQEIPPSEGGDPTLLWVGSPAEKVDWLRQTVELAGRRAVVVDAEPCAVVNALLYNYELQHREVVLLLHAGAHHLVVALVAGRQLLFARSCLIGGALYDEEELPARVVSAVDRHWNAILDLTDRRGPQRIFLSGGRARDGRLGETLHRETGFPVCELNPFDRIDYDPRSEAAGLIREQGPAFAVAVGLALRSFDDL